MSFDPAKIIADWQAAYKRANGFEPTANVSYQKGWFVFETVNIGVNRYRRFDVEQMIERLNNRRPS